MSYNTLARRAGAHKASTVGGGGGLLGPDWGIGFGLVAARPVASVIGRDAMRCEAACACGDIPAVGVSGGPRRAVACRGRAPRRPAPLRFHSFLDDFPRRI